ncbi:hypothetical protein T265_15579, partial [Opisthorchis viverrini]
MLWIRYVDDTFVIMKRDSVHDAHELLNTTFGDIKSTIELERNSRLPFVDVLVNIKMDGILETRLYRKETHTDQILNYNNNHLINHKKSCAQTLFKREETHCSTTELRKKEGIHLFRVFQNNGSPRHSVKRSSKKTSQPQQQQERANRRSSKCVRNLRKELIDQFYLNSEKNINAIGGDSCVNVIPKS